MPGISIDGFMADFQWTDQKNEAAVLLAQGYSQREVAEKIKCSIRTVERMMSVNEFRAEVDQLSLMVGIASKAERLRCAMRAVRQKVKDESIETDKDILDWLKYAQSEKEGIKLGLDAAFTAALTSLAGSGQAINNQPCGETETGNTGT